MRDRTLPEDRPTLQEVQQQFDVWRSNPKKRRQIPQELWDAAVKLCDKHSISQVALALKLSHRDLKNRKIRSIQRESHQSQPTFIEMDNPSGGPLATGNRMIELEDSQGRKMRISWNGERDFDVSSLAKGFWSLPC